VVNTAKLEGYMINLSLTFEEVAENTWVINDEEKGLEQVVLLLEEPLVIIRVKVMTIPESNRESFFEQLLRLNAQDMVHGAYALDEDDVLLNDTLEYDTMDQGELQASLDAIGLALAQHYPILSKYRKA
jgi:hypothetical protein